MYFIQIIKVKKNILNFNKILKVNDSNGISLEDMMSNLRKKFETDVEILGPFTYILEDAVNLSKKINEGEVELHHSLDILKKKQDEISRFVVDVNKIKFDGKEPPREH